jgi:hypothetical protein
MMLLIQAPKLDGAKPSGCRPSQINNALFTIEQSKNQTAAVRFFWPMADYTA